MRSALDHAGCAPDQVRAAYLALTGSGSAAAAVAAELLPHTEIVVESDAMAALASGAYGGPGVAVIAGTGSVAVGIGSDGVRVFRGGWGPTLGDEGSGYWIGLSALRVIARADDGVEPPTALTSLLCAALHVDSVREMFDPVYSGRADRGAIAALTPVVTKAAQAGDVAAGAIVDAAVEHLTAMIAATASAVRLHGEHRRVVLSGGVLLADGPIADGLVAKVPARLPGFEVIRPIVPPVVGAYYLALEATGRTVDGDALRARATSGDWPLDLRSTLDLRSASHPVHSTQEAKSS